MKGMKSLYRVLAAVMVLGLCATVFAAQQGASVTTSLREAPDDMYVEGRGSVGSVTFSTNEDGELVADVQLNKGAENATFSVRLNAHPDKRQNWTAPREIGRVSTNRHGKASATFTAVAPDDEKDSTIYAQLVLSGQEVSYATSEVEVSLKK